MTYITSILEGMNFDIVDTGRTTTYVVREEDRKGARDEVVTRLTNANMNYQFHPISSRSGLGHIEVNG